MHPNQLGHDMAAASVLAASIVAAAATDVADTVGVWVSDGSKLGVIGIGMVLAYRITSKAQRDAVAVYRESARDADERLDKERADWARREAALVAQLERLSNQPPK